MDTDHVKDLDTTVYLVTAGLTGCFFLVASSESAPCAGGETITITFSPQLPQLPAAR